MSEKYTVIMHIGRHSNVALLRDNASGYLVVRRMVNAKQAEIYRTLQNLMEPHIPRIYSIADMGDGQYEILEEYIQGRTLEEILEEMGCVQEATAAAYLVQLCDVLEKIHKAGLIHRDIKPSNIIITPDQRLYLIDFDIARTRKEGRDADTEILGTQGFAAPEQFGFHQTRVQADIYSMGILLNILLTGKMPNECIPQGTIGHVVSQCIQMDTKKRYKSVKVLRTVLRPYLPKDHPQRCKVLRQIPGFRTFKIWKMVIALIFYGYFMLSILCYVIGLIIFQMPQDIISLAGSLFTLVVLFFYIFDVFEIRRRIPWLEKSRGRWFYSIKCILLGLAGWIGLADVVYWLTEGIISFLWKQ